MNRRGFFIEAVRVAETWLLTIIPQLTTIDRMAAHRKSDRRRDDPGAGPDVVNVDRRLHGRWSVMSHLAIKIDSSAILARDGRFNSFPRADSLLKTRRETRTVRFIGVSRYVDIRRIDSARSDVCFAV
jgi:hypothetical protein